MFWTTSPNADRCRRISAERPDFYRMREHTSPAFYKGTRATCSGWRAATPESVRLLIAAPPAWLVTVPPSAIGRTLRLGAGEQEAISLAREHRLPLLVDDKGARRAAQEAGLEITGTIGVLEAAARKGWLSLPEAFARLQATNFRVARRLVDEALRREAERRGK